MTAEQWATCDDPAAMIGALGGRASERKLRLFAVACCHRVWDLMVDPLSRDAVTVAERYADGMATERERRRRSEKYFGANSFPTWQMHSSAAAGWAVAKPLGVDEANHCARHAVHARSAHGHAAGLFAIDRSGDFAVIRDHLSGQNMREQAGDLRDIFGDPFAAQAIDSGWLTADVLALARSMYDSRDFAAMPILADALQDADCTDADVLAHCRQPGEHVRGCWVVDLLLGKS